MVPQGVRLRGADQRAEARGGVDWDFLMAAAAARPRAPTASCSSCRTCRAAGCPVVDPRSLAGSSACATSSQRRHAAGDHRGARLPVPGHCPDDAGLGVPFDKLVVVGGAVRNKFWMQNKADVVGR